jgi:hypothetical protein
VTLDRSGAVDFRNVVCDAHSDNEWWGGKKTVVFRQRKRASYPQYVAPWIETVVGGCGLGAADGCREANKIVPSAAAC